MARVIDKPRYQVDKASNRHKWRTIFRKIHLFIGLSFGLMFAFLGVTGGLLVFEHEIDEWLNPDLLISREKAVSYTLDEILAAAVAYSPTFKPQRLETPRTSSGVYLLRGTHKVNSEERPLDILVDPVKKVASGSRVWGEYPMSFIYNLHYTLLMGKSGSAIVGIAGFMLFIMAITGITLWWPRKGKWKKSLGIKIRAKKIRVIWDLHRSLGFFSSILLIVITVSGFYMVFPQYVSPVVNLISPLTPLPTALTSENNVSNTPITLQQVATIADKAFPNTELKRIYFPQGDDGIYRVIKREADSAIKSSGYSQVWIDQYSGEVLSVRSKETFTAGDYFVALQFPLHNGEALGTLGRVLIFSVSGMPLVLFVTGFIIWKRKKQVKYKKSV